MLEGLKKNVTLESKENEKMDCSIYTSFEDIENLREEWDTFIESIDGEIFLTFDWCRLWWNNYGKKRILRIFFFRKNGKLVGLIPIFIEKIWLGIIPIRVVKIVGSDFTIVQFTFPVKDDCPQQVVQFFLKELNKMHWDLCSIGPLTCFFYSTKYLAGIFEFQKFDYKIQLDEIGVQTIYELPNSWDEYLAKLSKQERKKLRKNYKIIQSENLNLQIDTAKIENFEFFFNTFVELHQDRWRRSRKPGHFGDWPRSYKFHKEVAEAQMRLGRLRLLKVQIQENFAFRYTYAFGQRHFVFLVGRTLSDSPNGIDFGRLLFSEQTKNAIENSIKNIDSMRGKYDYKLHLGGKLFTLARINIERKGIFNKIRLIIFKIFCEILDLFYYKIWYCRLAPKFSITYGPLCSLWIKTNGLFHNNISKSSILRFRKIEPPNKTI